MKKLLVLIFLIISFATGYSQNKSSSLPILYDTIFTKPTVLASFPGGDSAWKKYVKKNMKYPRKAWWDELETDVVIKVVIDKDGSIISARHLTISGDYGFEEEAVRLVMKSGKWLPATFHGTPVKSEGELTIGFRLR